MRVMLKLTLDCDPDAAWRALHSPRAVAELYGPLVDLVPLEPGGLPARWEPGDDAGVEMAITGSIPLGRQLIHVSDRERADPRTGDTVRILRDTGIPLSGPLAALDVWDHQMAVSAAPGDPTKTLWRDRLVIGGRAAPALWPALWAAWQWRGARLKALAPTWAYDPEVDAAEETASDAPATDGTSTDDPS